MARVAKNLSLDPDVVEAAERWAEANNTTLSKVVGDYLRQLTGRFEEGVRRSAGDEEVQPPYSATVLRLMGVGLGSEGGSKDPVAEYHAYLERKYRGE